MPQIGALDLEILNLGIKKNGRFNEGDIENSPLNRLGVGRLLDELASLKERKFIDMNADGSFTITELARRLLWNPSIPLWVRVLRLLEIKSKSLEEISETLEEPGTELLPTIEKLRKNHFVLMVPIRNETKLIKMYEILQDGVAILKKGEVDGFQTDVFDTAKEDTEILQMIDSVIAELKELENDKKEEIIQKLLSIKSRLDI